MEAVALWLGGGDFLAEGLGDGVEAHFPEGAFAGGGGEQGEPMREEVNVTVCLL